MRFLKTFFGLAVIFSVVFTAFFGAEKISAEKELIDMPNYKGILTVWQIDSFEGGTGSRRQFLSARANEFSKENKGILFLITSQTKESAEEKIKNGTYPDVISFGCGIAPTDLSEIPINAFYKGGILGGKVYAVPWCRGGYALIKHPKFSGCTAETDKKIPSLIVSQGDYTMPLMSLFVGGYEIEKYETLKPTDAYGKFLLGKTPYLLGTQRDIMRLKSRGENFSFYPVEGFCDLFQYAAITCKDEKKMQTAVKFIEYLLSEKSQSALSSISMLPVIGGVKPSEEIESLYNTDVSTTVSAFLSESEINRINGDLAAYFNGDKTLYINLKNIVI